MDEGAVVSQGQILGYLHSDELNLTVQQAKATIVAQEAIVAKLQAGSRPEEIAQASARVTSAEAALAQSKQEAEKLRKSYNASNGKAVSRQSVDDIQAKVKVSEAKLNEAQQAYNLAVAGPRQEDIAQAQAQLDAMKSELARQEFLLNQSVLTSPIDGVITARLLQVGDMASPNTPVFKLAENTKKWVRVYVNERDLGKIYNGMDANVTTDTYKNEPIHGTIGYISSVAEFTPKSVETEDVRTTLVYEVRVYVDDPDNRLRLGMPATVSIDI
ncbi:efflux RND transporter periplasmic adaptor subunit [Veillonella sp. AF13-2]